MKRLVFLLCIVVCSGGCTLKFAYNNLDRFILWQASEYVDLNAEQKEYVRAELDALLYWHRTTQLPVYADRFEALTSAVDREVTEQDIRAFFEDAEVWYKALEGKSLPMLTEVLLSLTDEQVAELPKRFARDNEEFIEGEDEMTVLEAQARWRKEYVDAFKTFSGKLTREQDSYLTAQSVRYVPELAMWAAYRERWQAALFAALEERDDVDKFAATFAALVQDQKSYWGEEFTETTEANEAMALEVTAHLLSSLTDKQRVRFAEKVTEIAEDLRDLASQAAPQPPPGGGCLVRCADASQG